MKEIALTVNGGQVKAQEGSTVLDVCRANGVDIPTLCHFDGLPDVGACRLCVVEIQGERRPVPACTYPVREGLVVQTHTPKIEKYRRMLLELMFTEHNHFCMFCEKSGDCELQKLAYRYQMDHVRFPYAFPSLPVDTISSYLVVDHNRCVLCGRCIRTCNEVVANRTLDFAKRGWRTTVTADLGQSLGESSCVSCGACLQVCPTGAIFSKLSLYKGRKSECQKTETACPGCGAGCNLEALTKDNNLVMIEGPGVEDARSSLCRIGRFEVLRTDRPRVTTPMVKKGRKNPQETSLQHAVEAVVEGLSRQPGAGAGLASSGYTFETLQSFKKLFGGTANRMDTLDGGWHRFVTEGINLFRKDGGLGIETDTTDILQADCIMVVGADPLKTNPMVGTFVRRAVSQNKAKLIVVNSQRDVFPLWTDVWLKPAAGSEEVLFKGLARSLLEKNLAGKRAIAPELAGYLAKYKPDAAAQASGVELRDLGSAAEMYGLARHAVVIYGDGLMEKNDPRLVQLLLMLADLTGNWTIDHIRVISLKPACNSRGAWQLGLAAKPLARDEVRSLYLLLGSDQVAPKDLEWMKKLDFLAVQASHESEATAMADVVLPSPAWTERDGTYLSMDGRVLKARQILKPRGDLPSDVEILERVSSGLSRGVRKTEEVKRG